MGQETETDTAQDPVVLVSDAPQGSWEEVTLLQ